MYCVTWIDGPEHNDVARLYDTYDEACMAHRELVRDGCDPGPICTVLGGPFPGNPPTQEQLAKSEPKDNVWVPTGPFHAGRPAE